MENQLFGFYFQPDETHEISSSAGLFAPEVVASNIVSGIKVTTVSIAAFPVIARQKIIVTKWCCHHMRHAK